MNINYRTAAVAVCLFLCLRTALAQTEAKVSYSWEPFALSEVALGDGCFRQAMDHHAEYVLSLDIDRLIPHVLKRSGLTPKGKNYGGWEKNGGKTYGHYMSACALYYRATGDVRFRERTDRIVAELRRCRDAAKDGWWLSAGLKKSLEKICRGELTLNRPDEAGQPWNVNDMGNSWYGVHKDLAGLRDVWLYTGNDDARRLLLETADLIVPYILDANSDLFQAMLSVEQGGMAEVMTDIYAISGDKRYLRVAEKFNHKNVVYPIANGEDVLRWRHANDQIPKFVGLSREYIYTENPLYLRAAKNFWQIVTEHHTTVIGGNSCYERFGKADSESFLLDYPSAETCNTYNMLKLSRNLFMLTGEKKYADYCEWALYNHILASLDPCHSGAITYYTNMQPGGMKQYSTAYDSFWCCVGTGMENHAKYGENIFYHNDGTLLVNMFVASTLRWKQTGMKVSMATRFPEDEQVKITVDDMGTFKGNIAVRNPQWCKGKMTIRHNGKKLSTGSYDDFISIGAISKGDVIEITLPMTMDIRRANDDKHLGSFTYGPLVLAGVLADVADGSDIVGGSLDLKTDVPLADIPQFKGNVKKPESMVKHEKNAPLRFIARAVGGKDITLLPYYKVHHKRYSLYWNIYSAQEYDEMLRCYADHVVAGNADSEAAHALLSEADTTGWYDAGWVKNKQYRRAKRGGWFEYRLKTNASADSNVSEGYKLICRVWGDEPERPEATIYADGTKVGELKLEERQHLTYVDLTYDIPLDVTRGKESVTVRFAANEGHRSPALFDVKMVNKRMK